MEGNKTLDLIGQLAQEKYPTHSWMDNKMFNEQMDKREAFVKYIHNFEQTQSLQQTINEQNENIINMSYELSDSKSKIEELEEKLIQYESVNVNLRGMFANEIKLREEEQQANNKLIEGIKEYIYVTKNIQMKPSDAHKVAELIIKLNLPLS